MRSLQKIWRWLPLWLACCAGEANTEASSSSVPATPEDLSSEACAECHSSITQEWSESLHARAFSDPVFRAEYDPDPQDFCVGCHNPPASVSGGIDCATCHAEDRSLAGHAEGERLTEESCRPCHEFAFESPRYQPGQALQRTFSEWEASPDFALGRTCLDCHMPDSPTGPHASHRFRGFADTGFVRDAIHLEVSLAQAGEVSLVDFAITSRRVGHSFPTGDVYRSLRFVVSSDETTREEVFARRFAFRVTEDGRGHKLEEVEDTRLTPRETRRGQLEIPATQSVEWSLELHRLEPEEARRRGLREDQTRHVLRSGVVRASRLE